VLDSSSYVQPEDYPIQNDMQVPATHTSTSIHPIESTNSMSYLHRTSGPAGSSSSGLSSSLPNTRYKPPPMSILSEEAGSGESDNGRLTADAVYRGIEPAKQGSVPNGYSSSVATKQLLPRSTSRHGSFDFERPTWNKPSRMFRSTSHGSREIRSGLDPSRESLEGLHRGDSSNRPEEPHGRNRKRRSSPGTHTSKAQFQAPQESNSGSWGRSTGKRVLGSGVSKLVGLSHGPFSFEPPVPSPTPSNVSISTKGSQKSAVEQVMEKHRLEREREKQREKERQRELDRAIQKQRRTHHVHVDEFGLRSNSPHSQTSASGNSRSRKNRSLDLDLGLSWAAKTIKEEALLPPLRSRGLNGRSPSRATAKTANTPEDQSKLMGKEVADSFRQVLSDTDYASFRRCMCLVNEYELKADSFV
jgi:hypothetical protein